MEGERLQSSKVEYTFHALLEMPDIVNISGHVSAASNPPRSPSAGENSKENNVLDVINNMCSHNIVSQPSGGQSQREAFCLQEKPKCVSFGGDSV